MTTRERLLNSVTILLTVLALSASGRFVWVQLIQDKPTSPSVRKVADWQYYAGRGAIIGPPSAPVTITVFSDFQCPFCRSFSKTFRDVARSRPGQVKLVFRHYPIERLHPAALDAAMAGYCADLQGRFESIHNAFFDSQDSIGTRPWRSFAEAAGIKHLDAFASCMSDSATLSVIDRDRADAAKLKVKGTPAILVDDILISWDPDRALLDSLVSVALKKDHGT